MPEPGRTRIEEFGGSALDVHPSKLSGGLFQVDEGGDRFERGTWKVRRGYRHTNLEKKASPVVTLIGFEIPGLDFGIVHVAGTDAYGNLNAGIQEDVAAAPTGLISAAMTASHRAQAAEYRRVAYLNDGWRFMKKWNGRDAAATLGGIAGPSQDKDSWTPAVAGLLGSTAPGIHRFRYRYLDSTTGYVSNPSEERDLAIPPPTGLALSLPIATPPAATSNILRSSDPKVDRIVVEMTVVGGDQFFKVAEVPQSDASVTVNITDAAAEQKFLPWPEDGHDPPPIAKNVVSHRERLWLFGQVVHTQGLADVTAASDRVGIGSSPTDWVVDALGDFVAGTLPTTPWLFQRTGDARAYEILGFDTGTSELVLAEDYAGLTASDVTYKIFNRANVIWVSRAGFPEAFIPLKFINGPNSELAGDITAGVGYGPAMVFFSLSGMFKLSFDEDPLVDPVLTPLSTQYGAISSRVVVTVENVVYAMDRSGWQAWAGVFPQHISRPVDELIDLVDFSKEESFHAVFFPSIRAIRWFVVFKADTGSCPKRYVQYDVDTQNWSTGELKVGISESRLVPTASGPVVYYGDENGHVWIAEEGTCDGCRAVDSHLTADVGATTTVIPTTSAALPTANEGLAGVILKHVEGNEERLILSNTATTITLASALTTAPASGDRLFLGPIPARLRTRALTAPEAGPRRKVRHRYLWLMYQPIADQRFVKVRFFKDYASDASTWGDPEIRQNLPGLIYPGKDADLAPKVSGEFRDWLADLKFADGVVRVPFGGEWSRFVEAEIVVDEPDCPLELYAIEAGSEEAEGVA